MQMDDEADESLLFDQVVDNDLQELRKLKMQVLTVGAKSFEDRNQNYLEQFFIECS